jgi:D-amino-acid dehydrogenase
VLHDSPELQALDFSWSKTGKLVVYSSDESFEHAKAQAERQVAQGIDKRPLTVDSCIEIEPALATMAHRLVGGLYSPDDEAGDAHALATGLGELLAAGPTGSRFLGDVDVIGFVRDGARIRAVETSRGRMEADMFVLATGADARMLGRTVGARLPTYPIKGYSLTVPLRQNGNAPRVSVTDSANKIVYARIGETLRIAGAADLVGSSLAVDQRRIAMLKRVGQHDFPDAADWSSARPWAGLRPATPDGMPIVARMAVNNLLVNAGHGALGFTLALGSAELLAAIVAGRHAPVPPDHFRH